MIGVESDGKGIRMIPVEQSPVESANESKVLRERGEKTVIRRMSVVTALFTFEREPLTTEEMVNILMRQQSAEEQEQEREEKQRRREQGKENPRAPLNTHYAATMAGKEMAINELAAQVHLRDPTGKKPIVILFDGEKSLEKFFFFLQQKLIT